jgi:glycosyltransferase involved in cell wall biosynthesis
MWPQIRRSLPEAELLVLGGYQLWGYREQEARDMALREVPALADPPSGVRYLGPLPREQYAQALASAEVMLYPTAYEEMCCIAALEAAACGTVPVLSAVGALTARVQHDRTGLLITGDIARPRVRARFASQAARLLTEAPRLRLLSAAARAAADHTIDRVIDRLLAAISR